MLAEDLRGDDLTSMIHNRFDELETFYEEIISHIMLAKYSTSELFNPTRQNRRFQYFLFHLREAVLEIIEKACSNHYHHKIWYEYNSARRIISVHEYVSLNNRSNNCLCTDDLERTVLTKPFTLPTSYPSHFAYQINRNADGVTTVFETSQYSRDTISFDTGIF